MATLIGMIAGILFFVMMVLTRPRTKNKNKF